MRRRVCLPLFTGVDPPVSVYLAEEQVRRVKRQRADPPMVVPRPMRLGIVVKEFPPDVIGGTETQTKRMAGELHRRGHDVTVFTKRYRSHDDSDVPYEVVRVPQLDWTPFLSTMTFLLTCLPILLRRSPRLDYLQCMMLYPIGFLGYVTSTITGLPYFAWIRGGDYYLMNEVWWKRWMMRQVLADSLVLAQSPEIRDDVRADFPDLNPTIEVLGNGVDVPEATCDPDSTTLLFVGRFAPKKGLEYLIRAIGRMGRDVDLVLVGDGQERPKIEALAAEKNVEVTFEGFVSPEKVREYYADAGVFVLPSIEGEGLPNAVLEAMAWGLPVVVTESGGLPSLIDDGEFGFVVPMRDPDALADRIRRLLDDPATRRRMGEAARRYVQRRHSWDVICAEIEGICDRFLVDGTRPIDARRQ